MQVFKISFQLAGDYHKQQIEWLGEGTTKRMPHCNKKIYEQLSTLLRKRFSPIVDREMFYVSYR
jgi:hypothetical protein